MNDLTIFDRPMFKRLAPNDTGAAPGHQGGIVIPKDLGPYFPDLEILAD
jgi:putative restriction endonuclease